MSDATDFQCPPLCRLPDGHEGPCDLTPRPDPMAELRAENEKLKRQAIILESMVLDALVVPVPPVMYNNFTIEWVKRRKKFLGFDREDGT